MLFALLNGCQLNTSQNKTSVLTFAYRVASKVAICQEKVYYRSAYFTISYHMPGAEHRPGQPRLIPNFQQFEPVGTGTARLGSGERRGSDLSGNAVMPPLVMNLVRLMEQARQEVLRRGSIEFYPPFWMYNKIAEITNDYSPHWRRRVLSGALEQEGINTGNIDIRPELSDQDLDERQLFFGDIAKAYGITAYSQFTPRQKHRFREELREDIREFNIGNVILNKQQRKVLVYIATATNIPINPDQETYHYYTVLQQPDITEKERKEDRRYFTW
jgi:hypothetical protein